MAKPIREKRTIPDYETSTPHGFKPGWDQCEFSWGDDNQCQRRALRQGRFDEKRGRYVYRWCREHNGGEEAGATEDQSAKVRAIITHLEERFDMLRNPRG